MSDAAALDALSDATNAYLRYAHPSWYVGLREDCIDETRLTLRHHSHAHLARVVITRDEFQNELHRRGDGFSFFTTLESKITFAIYQANSRGNWDLLTSWLSRLGLDSPAHPPLH